LYGAQLAGLVKPALQWAPEDDQAIRPAVLARLAWRRFQQGDVDDAGGFSPVYLRKSDAEM
jgi:transcription elongation factor GreA